MTHTLDFGKNAYVLEAHPISDEELELRMYGRIGAGGFFDDGEGITAKQVGELLAKSPRARKLTVKLSSPGGNAADGMAIRSMLSQHQARVTVDIEGLAASAASVIAMAGDTIRMHDGATMMLHEARGGAQGTVADFKRHINALEALNDGAATVYATRCGKTKEECRALMAAETWLTPEQAKAMGFVDDVVRAKAPAPKMSFDLDAFSYANVPAEVAARWRSAPAHEQHREAEMGYARIALALGLSESADEQAVMIALDRRKAELERSRDLARPFLELSGAADTAAAMGTLQAWKQSHDLLPKLQETIAANVATMESQERASLYAADAADPKGRKLSPAMKEFWDKQPVATLRAFMQSASYVVNVDKKTQPRSTPAADGQPTDGTQAAASGGGPKSYAQMSFIERHQLKRSDAERYRQLKNESIAAGEI